MRGIHALLLVAILCTPQLLLAQERATDTVSGSASTATLAQRLSGLQSLRGTFTQQVLAYDGELLDTSSGRFSLLHPGFFSWQIESPDQQLLMAAENYLWHYDVELETATRRDIGAAQASSPLAILSGDGALLDQHYLVEQLEANRYLLKPRQENTSFLSIVLSFEGEIPVAMAVEDRLQQTTRIDFADMELNVGLTPQEFIFTPPPGVDIYYHD